MKYKILWADDEIDLLKPHILFLESKGYEITSVNSGADALEKVDRNDFDLIFLDENMPGMTGLETLNYIKSTHPNVPVVMITKNEEEEIMEEAIGSKISDYLIKPLNPNQILSSAKKILDNKRLISDRTNQGYQREFQELSLALGDLNEHYDWAELYKKLLYWGMEIDKSADKSMMEVLSMQWTEANDHFADFVESKYQGWIQEPSAPRPMLSHRVLQKKVFPEIGEEPVVLIVIDNLRYDQWEVLEPTVAELFSIKGKDHYFSILPTTTAYARNSLFAGLLPLDIAKRDPEYWVGEDEDEGKNNFEHELIKRNLDRAGLEPKCTYSKILQVAQGKHVTDHISDLLQSPFNVLVYNFVDMLSHARTDMRMIRELTPDESAYRSLTKSWFLHSSLYDTLQALSNHKVKVMITTDHGMIRAKNPVKIIGDKSTNTNLRYKQGKNLGLNDKEAFHAMKPELIGLPKVNVSTTFAFARGEDFFVYPNNYNHYVRHYKDTFQHGGISMEEMIVPFITLSSRG
ncbi:MAG: bifunctional response regulator/alkaline phosphatase family protein [Cytophagales bacterium]|nr:bifunctional response regulator/alkaline phosphatase family protein [Cytophagales bacterium]